ncbi:SDR family oxidoreductase [Opitutales bacterium ASA1]|uniref:NAD-dependent epimerase/dehydratase family protein n=1 Tax=Congregicoccus parvus TaxID=3081749 RepID=UPI002B2B6E3F|nr:SDR family oxidoreductase [Opitutales bacterium ASA1]
MGNESHLATAANAGRTAFVTGGTGFIGRALVRHLLDDGWSVVCGVRPGSNWPRPSDAGVRVVACDLLGTGGPSVPRGTDVVFHLAGKAHALAEVEQDEDEYAEVNTGGTRLMLEAAAVAGVRAFVFFSTVKAVADAPADLQPIDESWDREPDTAYGRSKREAERLVLEGRHVPHAVVLRPCLVYGPEPKGNLEKMIEGVRSGRFPPIPEFGNRRSMVHVDDVCRAALLAATLPAAAGKTYLLADDQPFSTRELYRWLRAALGKPESSVTVPAWCLRGCALVGDVVGKLRGRRFVFDSDAFAKLKGSAWYSSAAIGHDLGWRPTRSLRDTIPEMVR